MWILYISLGLLLVLFAYCFCDGKPSQPIHQPPPVAPKKIVLSPWEYLVRETYIRALEGDKHARDWITNVLLEKHQGPKKQQSKKQKKNKKEQKIKRTPSNVIDEATITLINLGWSKDEALRQINSRVSKRYYPNTDSIVTDVITTK